jgi:ABC-type Zn uptake system ZnuABC Zn-binding protein ZnuA
MGVQPTRPGSDLMPEHPINDPKHWLDRAKEARALAEQIADPEAKRTMLKNAADYERLAQRAQERAAGRLPQSNSFRSREVVRELAVMGYSNKRVLGVMRPRMQLSFLFDCDDVALPAVKLDPDTELARVVPADVEVRQRAGLHDV